MKLMISEISKLTGVSVRALHYYDEIGLLIPSEISEAGYRYYDNNALERLQQIMFFKELDFSLKEIIKILSHPNFDKSEALIKQKKVLTLKKERLEKLIALVDENMKGVKIMSFEEFDMSEIENTKKQYAEEAKARWGKTDAYKQSEKRTKNYTKDDWKKISDKSDNIMTSFASFVGSDPASQKVQTLVSVWKAFITESYYDCTNEILAGLGEMYLADDRFKNNIDKFGEGTAKLMSEAIKIYTIK